jgi:hypothetical protein
VVAMVEIYLEVLAVPEVLPVEVQALNQVVA